MAHPTTEAIILQFATDRATNYRWRMLYMVGHALNTIHGYRVTNPASLGMAPTHSPSGQSSTSKKGVFPLCSMI